MSVDDDNGQTREPFAREWLGVRGVRPVAWLIALGVFTLDQLRALVHDGGADSDRVAAAALSANDVDKVRAACTALAACTHVERVPVADATDALGAQLWRAVALGEEARVVRLLGEAAFSPHIDRAAVHNWASCGDTVLHVAIYAGHINLVRKLLHVGACPNALGKRKDFSPLMTAVRHNRPKAILELGKASWRGRVLKVEERDISFNTPLHVAAWHGHAECMRALFRVGARAHVNNASQATPLMVASERGHLECVRELIARGARVSQQGSLGITALHKACVHGHSAVVTELINHGAHVNASVSIGITPVLAACKSGSVDVLRALFRAEAPLSIKMRFEVTTALGAAVLAARLDAACFLLHQGVRKDEIACIPPGHGIRSDAVFSARFLHGGAFADALEEASMRGALGMAAWRGGACAAMLANLPAPVPDHPVRDPEDEHEDDYSWLLPSSDESDPEPAHAPSDSDTDSVGSCHLFD